MVNRLSAEDVDKSGNVRNILLVVATLIASVTFQAGVNPPGGVWQKGDYAGRAIYAFDSAAYYVFLISNTLALATSMHVIISITYKSLFHLEIVIATISMIVTYGSAIFAVTPHEMRFQYAIAAFAVPFIMQCLIQLFNVLVFKNDHKSDPKNGNNE
ncbi:hypothetical protein ES319_A12G104400v1 [Gossypium barbadense]|uniref:PGG domain-containing protein n=2 Tax=Gossypium TaxID=3633 RepID=A0A5J5TC12_GOSBA|nr:hypothetical protein ES319_A12G104400v1 [Gossypium barbadense]TYG89603.1 hypothetical protein ES288_A12G112600v1 [Gossypium darwinii]